MKQIKTTKDKMLLYVILVAVVLAVALRAMVYSYLNPKKTTMWVFNDNYKAGTPLTESMLKSVRADDTIVMAGATAKADAIFVVGDEVKALVNSGDSLRMDVVKDMALTKSILSVAGGNSLEMMMDPSKIAVTVPADSFSGITDALAEGSRVNMYATVHNGDNISTTLLFQNLRVLGTSKKDNVINGITLEVTAEQSLKLVNAAEYTSLHFGLIDPTGYQAVEDGLSFTPSNIQASTGGVS